MWISELEVSQNLKDRQKEIDNIAKAKILQEAGKPHKKIINFDIKKFIKISNMRRKIFSTYIQKKQKKNLPISEFKKILLLVKELVEKNGSNLHFVYLPEYSRYKNTYDNSSYYLIKKIVNELNVSFIDINKKVFKKETDPLNLFPFKLFGHYNEDGYRKIAEAIYKTAQ